MLRISPPLRLAQLGQELRELRMATGMKLDQAATGLRCSRGKISNVENGHTIVTPGYVRDALTLYGADEVVQARCLRLITEARRTPWWKPYAKVLGDYVIYETEAQLVRYWQAQLVPGLLQTFDYARAAIAADRPWEDRDLVQLRAHARIARQWIVKDGESAVRIDAIVAEEALRRPIGGPEVMAGQLGKLVEVGEWPNVSVRVLPLAVGGHAGLACSFLLFTLPDIPLVLYREGSDEIVDQGGRVPEFKTRFEHLSAAAASVGESAALIRSIREGFIQRADQPVA